VAHWMMDDYLGHDMAEEMRERAEKDEPAPSEQSA